MYIYIYIHIDLQSLGPCGTDAKCRSNALATQSELETNRKRKEQLLTPHKRPTQRKRINSVPFELRLSLFALSVLFTFAMFIVMLCFLLRCRCEVSI